MYNNTMRKNAKDEMDNPFQSSRIRIQPKVSSDITIYIDDVIEEPSKYRDETQILFNASPSDDITIVINSPGGQVNTALQLVEAIQFCQANVTAVVTGDCMSAATLITLACPNILIMDSAEILIHTGVFHSGGQSPKIKAHVDFTHSQLEKMIDDFYTGFLTKKEIEEVKNGKEFWFNADEARTRFQSRLKYLKSLHQKEQKRIAKEEKKVKEESENTEE